ncbi:MAG: NgoFVII family restriction endonuclease [Bacteriodetes bacterium]|nr:NgoFVII family restriction endonuclease [Bacteroidota bacterium]
MSIITNNLFDKVLVEPLQQNANRLYIVSGYATALMATRHIQYVKANYTNREFSIKLIVGMCPQDGIEFRNHYSFNQLQSRMFDVDFECRYLAKRPPVHSKIYAWFNNDIPIVGFVGSANYTQNAFSKSMREIVGHANPTDCFDYYKSIEGDTIMCNDSEVTSYIEIYRNESTLKKSTESETATTFKTTGLNKVTLTLLDSKTNDTPKKSGLNWGQRGHREPNQAYINIPAEIGRSGFFPDRYVNFTVITDDNKQFICVRAQDGGKGLHTTLNNSLLGEYFRNRLDLPNGVFVTKNHLLHYGRTDVDFYKIDDETYYMDFSVH